MRYPARDKFTVLQIPENPRLLCENLRGIPHPLHVPHTAGQPIPRLDVGTGF